MREVLNRLEFGGLRLIDRLKHRLQVSLTALQERSIQITLVMVLGLVGANIVIAETAQVDYIQQFLSTTIAAIVTFLSVYLSIDILTPYLKHSERKRIASSGAVTGEYSNDILITLEEWLPESVEWKGEYSPVAAAIEDVPETRRNLNQLDYKFRDEMYEIPDDLWGVIEPAAPQMQELFEREGLFSQLKPRLDNISDDIFELSQTTYYRSFQTNFCPDLNLGSGYTLRDLTKSELVDNGEIRLLRDSPFSNHLGAAGLVVSADGVTALSTRSGQVAVDKYAKSLSFSGSLTLEKLNDQGDLRSPLLSEIDEELNIPESAVRDAVYLGTTRRMERLGKPDVLVLVLVEEIDTWENPTEEFTNLDLLELASEERIESISQLFDIDIAEELIEEILFRIDVTSRHASIGLVSFLALYSRQVKIHQQSKICE